jgi:hypothetical protein
MRTTSILICAILLGSLAFCQSGSAQCWENVTTNCGDLFDDWPCENFCGNEYSSPTCEEVTGATRRESVTYAVESPQGKAGRANPVSVACVTYLQCSVNIWVQCAGDPSKNQCWEWGTGAVKEWKDVRYAFGLSCP